MSDSSIRNSKDLVCGGLGVKASESFLEYLNGTKVATVLADPPWRFNNRTGKMAPEHKRLLRYSTLSVDEIAGLPVSEIVLPQSHLYLWVPNALILEGLKVMESWGFTYKTNLVWYKVRKDGGPDGRGVGFYFRNVTELVLFGVRGNLRTLPPGRSQVNIIVSRKREHSRKPEDLYDIIEKCSPGPYLELFARVSRPNWYQWGNQLGSYEPSNYPSYTLHSDTLTCLPRP
ncbi:MT-A70 family methyltransferase [Desulfotruncus alcoholivorax]|uniref:MT-A70 family methyltransferase n=1 Tax=Desulfotruncus alcoholivorax TaxID=265477 RepID=UPI000417A4B2|nr:MT-A70 family methyltransferase [Desulfotruncus alcoholivorax]